MKTKCKFLKKKMKEKPILSKTTSVSDVAEDSYGS
jgi:hypothetical protein